MAVIQLSAIILHCSIWYGRIRRREINKSGCEWLRRRRRTKVMGNFPLVPFQTLQAQNKCCVSVRMADWFDVGAKQSINGSYKSWALRWNYNVNEKKTKDEGKGGNVKLCDFCPAVIKSSAERRPTEMLQSWLCHQQDNHLLDLNSIL